ncbi:MAG: TIGR02597 family protein [Puniceicoccaceae bacterium]
MRTANYRFVIAAAMGLVLTGFSLNAETTDPVGAMVITAKSGSDTGLSVPFHRSPLFTGSIKDISGSVVTVHGSPGWTTDTYISAGHFALLASGSKEGAYFTILSNGSDTLTLEIVDTDLSGVASNASDPALGDAIDIYPYWTPATLLPATLPAGSSILLFDKSTTINKSAAVLLNYNGTNWLRGFSVANDELLHPYESFVLRLPDSADVDLVFHGKVPMSKHRLVINNDGGSGTSVQTDFRISYMSPVSTTVSEMGLGFEAGDSLLFFDNTASGINKSAAIILNFNGTDWLQGFSVANDFVIEPGQSMVFRKIGGTTQPEVVWASLQNYLQ